MEVLFFIVIGCAAIWFCSEVLAPILGGIFKAGGNVLVGMFKLAFCLLLVALVIAAMN